MRELDIKVADLRRREEQLDEIEEDWSASAIGARGAGEPAPNEPPAEDDPERGRGRLSVFDHRQVELDRREQEVRRLEERLGGLERSLARKEADLGAFADLFQHSLARIEEATAGSGDPSESDATQRLRFWTRDSSAGGGPRLDHRSRGSDPHNRGLTRTMRV